MSSYVVEDFIIDEITCALRESIVTEGRYPSRWPDLRYVDDYLRTIAMQHPREIAKLLVKMNEDASRGTFEAFNGSAYVFKSRRFSMPNNVQLYKHLKSYLYQCDEGKDVTRSALFRGLVKYKAALAFKIVEDLPEYKLADW